MIMTSGSSIDILKEITGLKFGDYEKFQLPKNGERCLMMINSKFGKFKVNFNENK